MSDTDLRKRIEFYRETGDKKVLERLVALFGKYVASIARNYQNKGLEICDLINAGMIGLIHIIDNTFDIEGPTKFVTYANAVISRYMREALDEYNNLVRLPKNIRNDMRWVRQISNELEAKGESEENVHKAIKEEAEKRLGDVPDYTLARFYSYIDYGRYTNYSIDCTLDDTIVVDPIDLLGAHHNDAIANTTESDIKDQVQAMIKTSLTQREQDVIYYYFFDSITLEYIKETYNITNAERVRQIRDIALNKLRELNLTNLASLFH